jgi:hypothetical protein
MCGISVSLLFAIVTRPIDREDHITKAPPSTMNLLKI